MIKRITVAVAAMLFFAGMAGADEGPLKALIVTGQNNHGWQVSSPILRDILQQTGLFTVEMAVSPAKGQDMSGFKTDFAAFDVVVLDYNGDAWPEEAKNNFVKYVSDGGGVVVYHAASNAFADWPEYNRITGLGGWSGRTEKDGPYAYWKGGKIVRDMTPGKGGSHGQQQAFKVVVRQADHPVTKGLPAEWMHAMDELYANLRGPAENLEVLATAYSDPATGGTGKDEPVLFTVQYGKGRVFHTVLGHAGKPPVPAMQCVGFIVTLQRGAEWAATGKVTQAVPADFPTADAVRKWEAYRPIRPLQELLSDVVRYDYGDSRLPLTDVTDLISATLDSPQELQDIEDSLLEVLKGDCTLAGKQFICKELSLIGTERSVPVLSHMLVNEDTSDMARYAIERMPGQAADAALMEALGKTEGIMRIGIINSLGQRRCGQALPAIEGLLRDSDAETASAAAAALGKIRGPGAMKALAGAKNSAKGEVLATVLDSYLSCAGELKDSGDTAGALAAYREVYSSSAPAPARAAALRGVLLCSGDDAGDLAMEVLAGDDKAMHALVMGVLDELPGTGTIEAIVGRLADISPSGQVQAIKALAARGDNSVLPALLRAAEGGDESVRAAAFSAIGALGGAAEVQMLARAAADGGATGSVAADALNRLKGPDIDSAILDAVGTSDDRMRVALIQSAEARGVESAGPVLLEAAADSDKAVRMAALKALEGIAGQVELPSLLDIYKQAGSTAERRMCEKAILAAGGRAADVQRRDAHLIGAIADTEGTVREGLLGIIGSFGGEMALGSVAADAVYGGGDVRTAAVRALGQWPSSAAAPLLLEIARADNGQVLRILALRGYIRAAGLSTDQGQGVMLGMYSRAMQLADRAEEKTQILAGVQRVHIPGALDLVEPYLADEQLAREAQAAYVAIAVGMREAYPQEAMAAMARIRQLGARVVAEVSPGFVVNVGPDDAELTLPMVLETDGLGVLHTVVPTETEEAVKQGAGGKAVYLFSTTAAGTLSMEFNMNCAGQTNDSWYITVDDEPFFNWNDNSTEGWEWRTFPQVYRLKAGPHTLTVDQREDGARMANIKLTLSAE